VYAPQNIQSMECGAGHDLTVQCIKGSLLAIYLTWYILFLFSQTLRRKTVECEKVERQITGVFSVFPMSVRERPYET